jgi:hypothetical protein
MSKVKEKWAVIQDLLLEAGLTPEQAKRAAVAACLPEPSESQVEYAKTRPLKPRKIAALLDRMCNKS